jgi:hypothetical protein
MTTKKGLKGVISNDNVNKIKGTIAEEVISELFKDLGFNVHRSGMEYAFPALGNRNKLKAADEITLKHIKHYPDFILQRKVDNVVFLAEVKYRTNGSYSLKKEYERYFGEYPFLSAYIILVGPTRIVAKKASDIMDNGNKMYLISDIEDFHCNDTRKKETIKGYVNLLNSILNSF